MFGDLVYTYIQYACQGVAMNHDQNFKNLIIDYPIDALRLFAPNESMDLSRAVSVTPVRQEQLKQHLSDGHRELDVPLLIE